MSSGILFLLNLLMTTIECVTLLLLGRAFFREKISSWKLLCALAVLIGTTVLTLIITSGLFWVKIGLLLIIWSLWTKLVFQENIIKSMMVAALNLSLLNLVDNFFLMGFTLLMHKPAQVYLSDPYAYYLFGYTAKCIAVLCVVIIRLIVTRWFKAQTNTWTTWLRTIMFPVASLLIAGLLLQSYTTEPRLARTALLCSIILLATDVLAVFLLNHLETQQQAINDNIILNCNIKLARDNISAWMNAYAGQRKQTHDFVNQLSVIQGLAKKEAPDGELSAYVQKLLKTDFTPSHLVKTGRSVVDVIIDQKYAISQAKGIHFQFRLDNLTNFALSDDDLVVVLSNLLNNALAACEAIPNPEQRKILLKMRVTGQSSLLYIENTTAKPVKIKNNRIVSDRKVPSAHGYGTKNIASIMEQYQAVYAMDYLPQTHTFCFSAEIPHAN